MQSRIDDLEEQGVLDRALIAELQAKADVDRETIAEVLADAVFDREEIARLSKEAEVDQAEIQTLMTAAVLDHQQVDDLKQVRAANLDELDQLKAALDTCRLIGAAVGMLMERYDMTRERAFLFLTRMSQDTNRKVRDLAAEIAQGQARTGSGPTPANTRTPPGLRNLRRVDPDASAS